MPHLELLFHCVENGNVKRLLELLHGDPEGAKGSDKQGQTLLHFACAVGKVDIVLHLVNRYDCDILLKENVYGFTALHVACFYDNQQVAMELLKRITGNVEEAANTKDKFGWTCLHHAARNGNASLCKILIAHNCRAGEVNNLRKTACHYAAEHGHLSTLQLLYESINDTTVSLQATGNESVPSLLHSAALNNHVGIVEWLKAQCYPPMTLFSRMLDHISRDNKPEYPEDTAAARNHGALKTDLYHYRQRFKGWVQDISQEQMPLNQLKLCVCGHPRVGKSALRESLCKNYFQAHFGKDVKQTVDTDVGRHTSGINIASLQLSSNLTFTLWDFAGQVENFVTHHFFISTESTVFLVMVNLTASLLDQRAQLISWLGFVKSRNLGQLPFSSSVSQTDKVPMIRSRQRNKRTLPGRLRCGTMQWSGTTSDSSQDSSSSNSSCSGGSGGGGGTNSNNNNEESAQQAYTSVIQQIPVLIVGSHYDLVPGERAEAVLKEVQALVVEVREMFQEYLEVYPKILPLNCLKATSTEMKDLKEELTTVSTKLVETQPLYPRVTLRVSEMVASLRADRPGVKVLHWGDFYDTVLKKVNPLLSERQLAYICVCLTNAGVLVYLEQGVLSNYVFVDPQWLCCDVLGRALAPKSFPTAQLSPAQSMELTGSTIRGLLASHVDQKYIEIILTLLQNFDLCYKKKGCNQDDNDEVYVFPSLMEVPFDAQLWQPDRYFTAYVGRQLVCLESTDVFPPGFFAYLQAHVAKQCEAVHIWRDSLLVNCDTHQALVQMNTAKTSVRLVGRACPSSAHACLKLLDQIHGNVGSLVKNLCPTIFLETKILSSSDLRLCNYDGSGREPHSYGVSEVFDADSRGEGVENPHTKERETLEELIFFGDRELKRSQGGRETKVAHMSREIVDKVQELLQDNEEEERKNDKTWRDLAHELGLGQYLGLFESRSPQSTRLLLLKYGERHKWSVGSLMAALERLGRLDVRNYLRARYVLS